VPHSTKQSHGFLREEADDALQAITHYLNERSVVLCEPQEGKTMRLFRHWLKASGCRLAKHDSSGNVRLANICGTRSTSLAHYLNERSVVLCEPQEGKTMRLFRAMGHFGNGREEL
jgi:hypothetical protein